MDDREKATKTASFAAVSAFIGVGFALYNGALGIIYRSLWHGSICVYYLMLVLLRSSIVLAFRKKQEKTFSRYMWIRLALIVLNLSLFVPIALMIRGERSYTYGLIPAIAMATYTTYRIAAAIFHFLRSRKRDSFLLSELRRINMIDALVSVLTLQNALIIANNGSMNGMQTLTSWTSAGIQAVIIAISVLPPRK